MDLFDSLRAAIFGDADASDLEDEQSLFSQAMATALLPIRIITSRTAIKAYLSAFLFLTISTVLVSISTTAYFLFYYNFIPQINLEKTIYLQYGADSYPHALVALPKQALISQQPYDINIVLHMPRSPTNLAAGNFMLDISLMSDSDWANTSPLSYIIPNATLIASSQPLHRSRRPATLPYASPLTSLSHTLLHLPAHLLTLKDIDSSIISVPMFERLSFSRGTKNIPSHAYIELQSQKPLAPPESCPIQGLSLLQVLPAAPSIHTRNLQVYDARLIFRARFKGLRYIVYNYKVASFLIFTTMFYIFATSSVAVAWAALHSMSSPSHGGLHAGKQRQHLKDGSSTPNSGLISPGPQKIKSENRSRGLYSVRAHQEGEQTPDSSEAEQGMQTDTSTSFPGIGRTVPPLRYPGSPRAQDESAGQAVGTHQDDPTHDAEDEDDGEIITPSGFQQDVKEEDNNDEDDGPGRFGDSGIGTSMESEHVPTGLVRRRSRQGRTGADR